MEHFIAIHLIKWKKLGTQNTKVLRTLSLAPLAICNAI